jgi:hypothetical protein
VTRPKLTTPKDDAQLTTPKPTTPKPTTPKPTTPKLTPRNRNGPGTILSSPGPVLEAFRRSALGLLEAPTRLVIVSRVWDERLSLD